MRQIILGPKGWPCSYEDCPPGLFLADNQICFKSEYSKDGKGVGYNSSGECYHGESDLIQPLTAVWEDV